MEKIYIIGCVGSGKTTLAKRLAKRLNMTYYELDDIAYKKESNKRRRVSVEEQLAAIEAIDKNDKWICEGVYRKSYHCLLDKCDKIIFIDTPFKRRRRNIIIRFIKQQLGLEKCNYKSDFKMLSLMLQWNKEFERTRHIFEKRLSLYDDKLIHINRIEDLTI